MYKENVLPEIIKELDPTKLLQNERIKLLMKLMKKANMGIWKFDLETKMIWFSEKVKDFYGLNTDNDFYSYHQIFQLIQREDVHKIVESYKNLISGKSDYNIMYKVTGTNNHKYRYLHSVADVEYDIKGNVKSILGIIQDVTERFKYTHDLTTDLPNKNYFLDELQKTIKVSTSVHAKLIVVVLDLDNFKIINNAFGQVTGDEFLIEVSQRLLKSYAERGVVARLNGDEFSVLIKDVTLDSEIDPLLEPLLSVFKEPFCINENITHLTASIGVSIYPDDGDTETELLKNAYIAMDQAKKLGKNNYQIYDLSMNEDLWQKINIELLLMKAIKNNEFVLYYQPQYQYSVELKKPKLRGFEALIRWNSPELGLQNPMDFIPIAEKTGLITQIGEWVLKTACHTCKKLEDKYGRDIIMSVNVSPIQLWRSEFNEIIISLIRDAGLKPTSLELEVTEGIFVDGFDNVANKLGSLKKLGIGVALDDFGTGYSSLSYLRKLPINFLKIDKSFIQEIDNSTNNELLIESIITLVHKLKIKTIAEGVETTKQLNCLLNANCDYIQGYYFGKPVPEELIDSIVGTTCSI